MHKAAYLLHGCCDKDEFFSDKYPSPSNSHWLPWLQKELLMKGYACQTPEMPTPYKTDYVEWKAVADGFAINAETVLVGHSCGGGFLLRWLGENNKRIAKLVLVAPWCDPKRTRDAFLDFKMNPALNNSIGEIHMFCADNEDVDGVKETVDAVMATLPRTTLHRFPSHGHFCFDDMKTEKFPELLKVILG